MAKSEGQVTQHVWCWVHFRLVHSYFIALAFRSKETKFLVTTGDGKFYSNGIDLEWLNGCDSHEDTTKFIRGFNELLIRMMTFPMPTVAALNGEHMCKLSNQDRTKTLQGEGLEHLSIPTCAPLIFLRNIPSFRMTKCSQKDEIYQISNAFPATIRNPNFKISHGAIIPSMQHTGWPQGFMQAASTNELYGQPRVLGKPVHYHSIRENRHLLLICLAYLCYSVPVYGQKKNESRDRVISFVKRQHILACSAAHEDCYDTRYHM